MCVHTMSSRSVTPPLPSSPVTPTARARPKPKRRKLTYERAGSIVPETPPPAPPPEDSDSSMSTFVVDPARLGSESELLATCLDFYPEDAREKLMACINKLAPDPLVDRFCKSAAAQESQAAAFRMLMEDDMKHVSSQVVFRFCGAIANMQRATKSRKFALSREVQSVLGIATVHAIGRRFMGEYAAPIPTLALKCAARACERAELDL